MARGPELLIGQIAIAKTGAAWLPFDADAPVERIAVCLGDAEAKGLLTSAEFAVKADGRRALPGPDRRRDRRRQRHEPGRCARARR